MLTTPGIKPADLQKQLAGLVQQQEIGVDRARKLDSPGPLSTHTSARIDSLTFRADGSPASPRRFGGRRARRTRQQRRCSLPKPSGSPRATSSGTTSSRSRRSRRCARRRSAVSRCPIPTSSRRRISRARAPWCRSGSGSTARPRRAPRAHQRPARNEHRTGDGRSRRPVLSQSDREHGRGVDRPRLRGRSRNGGDSQEVKIEVTLTIQQSPTRS